MVAAPLTTSSVGPDLPTAALNPRLVLVALGAPGDPAGPALLLPQVSRRLATLLTIPQRPIERPDSPAAALASLLGEPGPWLAPLPLDPGLALIEGSWAEALGAWRQPTLLVVNHSQLATGIPAAASALLEKWRVPQLGVLQWEGTWDGELRRREGLPWLGCLAAAEQDDRDAWIAALLRQRWNRCRAQLD